MGGEPVTGGNCVARGRWQISCSCCGGRKLIPKKSNSASVFGREVRITTPSPRICRPNFPLEFTIRLRQRGGETAAAPQHGTGRRRLDRGDHMQIPGIGSRDGLDHLLMRMVKAGEIERRGRGRYGPTRPPKRQIRQLAEVPTQKEAATLPKGADQHPQMCGPSIETMRHCSDRKPEPPREALLRDLFRHRKLDPFDVVRMIFPVQWACFPRAHDRNARPRYKTKVARRRSRWPLWRKRRE
jgi:hypothetical protein